MTDKLVLGRGSGSRRARVRPSVRDEKLNLQSAVKRAEQQDKAKELKDGVTPTDALVKMTRTGKP